MPAGSNPSGGVLSAVADAARRPRPVWRSRRAYVLATIAGIVGLGNLWRFPYMAGRHGGGDFLVAYIVSVLVIAVPLASLESAAGSLTRRSPVGAYRRAASRAGTAIGWSVIGLTAAILSYYLVITGWTLGYFLDSLRGDPRLFVDFVAGMGSLWLFLAVGALVFVVLVRGVAIIEKASLFLVPVLVVMVVGLAVFAQTLDGAAESRSFLLSPTADGLFDTATWRAAAGQAFYSVGVGQGFLIAYGSYVPAGANLIRSTTVVALTNALVSIVSAAMVFGVVFAFDISPTAGAELSFTAFPRVFGEIAGGDALAVGFFALLFVAGFTSCLGMAVVVMSAVRDETRMRTSRSAALTVGTVVAAGIPSALSFTDVGFDIGGQPFLDRVDQFTGSGVVVVLGLVGTAVLARGLPRRALAAAFSADTIRVGRWSIGPRTLIRWATVLPLVAAMAYGLGRAF
ncbi:MAG: sodium-dependent transporter [Acidimicrobiales bacterium]|nr:sodium-dependent transporter [Acidimicrobiales bacterium]